MAVKLSLLQKISYPGLRYFFYFFFNVVPYSPIKKVNKPTKELEGSFIWASTHHNYLCDIVISGVEARVPPKYIAKHTLFVFPIGWFIRFCGGVPVIRMQDNLRGNLDRSQNRRSFAEVIQAAKVGWPICIFPEGQSLPTPGLILPLKVGVAKLALGIGDELDFDTDISIVCSGLEYGHRNKVASGMTLRYAKPILLRDYKEMYRADPVGTVGKLMANITNEMVRVFPDFPDWDRYEFSYRLFNSGVADSRCQVSHFFRSVSPDGYLEFKKMFVEFSEQTERAGIPLWSWRSNLEWTDLYVSYRVRDCAFLVLGLPVLVWSLIQNTLPGFVLEKSVHLLSVDETEMMSIRVMAAPLVLPLVYGAQVYLVSKWQGFNISWIHFLLYAGSSMVVWYAVERWKNNFWRFWGCLIWRVKGPSQSLRTKFKQMQEMLDSVGRP